MRAKFIILFLLLTTSCDFRKQEQDYSTNEKLDEVCVDYPDNFILWNDLFNQNTEKYFVYVFSYDCYYCKEIKNDIVSFCNVSIAPVFLVEYTKSVTVDYKTDKTIGAKTIDNVFIRGTPTMIFIKDGEIKTNVAGKRNVLDFIDLNKNQ